MGEGFRVRHNLHKVQIFCAALFVMLTLQIMNSPQSAALPEHSPTSVDLQLAGAGKSHYDLFEPIGSKARGTIMIIHGGAWRAWDGSNRQNTNLAVAWQLLGYRVINVDYRQATRLTNPNDPVLSAQGMLNDIDGFIDQTKAAWPNEPLCLYGQSAGGHLALVGSAERPHSIKCTISEAGPADFMAWANQTTADAGGGSYTCSSSPSVSWWYPHCYIPTFIDPAPSNFVFWSPAARWQANYPPNLLIGDADNDPIVHPINGQSMHAAAPSSIRTLLNGDPAGPQFVHSNVLAPQLVNYLDQRKSFLDSNTLAANGTPDTTLPDITNDQLKTCNAAVPTDDWKNNSRPDRATLLQSSRGWVQNPDPSSLVVSAAACSGGIFSQLDGITVFTNPGQAGAPLIPQNMLAQQTLTLPAGKVPKTFSSQFRGFLTAGWQLTLSAKDQNNQTISDLINCDGVTCNGVQTFAAHSGVLLASDSSNPDIGNTPPSKTFTLPVNTKSIVLTLKCGNASGCSRATINSDGQPYTNANLARSRDSTGTPAIMSLYDPTVTFESGGTTNPPEGNGGGVTTPAPFRPALELAAYQLAYSSYRQTNASISSTEPEIQSSQLTSTDTQHNKSKTQKSKEEDKDQKTATNTKTNPSSLPLFVIGGIIATIIASLLIWFIVVLIRRTTRT